MFFWRSAAISIPREPHTGFIVLSPGDLTDKSYLEHLHFPEIRREDEVYVPSRCHPLKLNQGQEPVKRRTYGFKTSSLYLTAITVLVSKKYRY
ncbi:hypothetical protein TNCV_610201 [Trichonephila clavipes]|nr:hypothetical protein TNCV_610201 [Trichonephila clavipes]